MKKYIKDNKKVFELINDKKIKIIEIKPIRRYKILGLVNERYIKNYCVIYEKMI